jgi:hypothetical protein
MNWPMISPLLRFLPAQRRIAANNREATEAATTVMTKVYATCHARERDKFRIAELYDPKDRRRRGANYSPKIWPMLCADIAPSTPAIHELTADIEALFDIRHAHCCDHDARSAKISEYGTGLFVIFVTAIKCLAAPGPAKAVGACVFELRPCKEERRPPGPVVVRCSMASKEACRLLWR